MTVTSCPTTGRNRTAHWVAERLNTERLDGEATQSGLNFRQDQSIPREHRSKDGDYTGSDFDRGHLAAAANHPANRDRVKETMIFSNASPQVGERFNRHLWKWLEEDTRQWATGADELYVFTGPLYRDPDDVLEEDGKQWVKYQIIGENAVAVPTHFFKVMLAEIDGQISVQAFILPERGRCHRPRRCRLE